MKKSLFPLILAFATLPAWAAQPAGVPDRLVLKPARVLGVPAGADAPEEIHDRLVPQPGRAPRVALTLDACMGATDDKLIEFLIQHKVPATIFATRRWLVRNPKTVAVLKSHLDMFEIEDHGANHIPAVIGTGKTVYGIPGEPDLAHLKREVDGGARAIKAHLGVTPHWYRAATAEYDAQSVAEIGKLGYGIAGFSVNADEGATLPAAIIEKRVKRATDGDVIIAHMNKPKSDTAKGLSAGIQYLLAKGFVFIRVDQAGLLKLPPAAPRHVRRHSRPRLPA